MHHHARILAALAAATLGLAGLVACTPTDPPGHCDITGGGDYDSSSLSLSVNVECLADPAPTTEPPATTEPPPPTTEPPPPTTEPPPPPPAGYPNESNTGPVAGTVFHDDTRCTLSTAGEVIDGANFTCASQLQVAADNVTITNSKVRAGIDNYAAGSRNKLTVEHSYFGSTSGACVSDFAVGAVNYTARYNQIMRFSDGFRVSGQNAADTIVIEHNLVLGCNDPGDHADGIQANENQSPTLINHNTIDIRDPDGSTDWTGAIFWADSSVGAPTVTNNILAGGGNVVFLFHFGGPSYVVHNNKVIDGSWEYGPVRNDSCASFDWAGNTLVNTDAAYQPASVAALACA